MARYKKKSTIPKGLRVFLVCCVALVILAVGSLCYLFTQTQLDHDNILQNISVAGVDVGGMSKDEAIAAVRSATENTYTKKSVVITIGDDTHEITPALSGAELDVEAAVNAAHGYGRSGFLFRRYREQQSATEKQVPVDITAYLNLDTDAIHAEADKLGEQYNRSVVQTTYHLEGTMPEDPGDGTGDRSLIIQVGQTGYVLDSSKLFQQILDAYNENVFSFTADCQVTRPADLDLDAIYRENCLAPVNASMNGQTYVITDQISGYGFKPLEVKNAIYNAAPGERLTVPFRVLEADITRESLEAGLFQDLLSEYTAEYGSNYNRDVNLVLSCQAVNGTVLLPGETFDYNSTLGERTPEAGYRLGNTYAGMETIQTYGGGICQTSSTLYYCALMADLEIVTRTNHGFISDYVPFGMDATVSWGGPEFRFKNNTKYPIKIEAYSSDGDVTVKLWGTDDKDYYVKMEYEVLGVYGWKRVTQEMSPDNSKGYKDGQVITSPYTGYKIQTYRCKYSKADDTLISKEPEALSVYSTRNQVVVKIVTKDDEPTNPTTPSDPTVPSTPPSETTEPSTEAPVTQ